MVVVVAIGRGPMVVVAVVVAIGTGPLVVVVTTGTGPLVVVVTTGTGPLVVVGLILSQTLLIQSQPGQHFSLFTHSMFLIIIEI